MGFLLDTNVISETRRPRPNVRVMEWMARLDPNDVFLSVITLGEIHAGILKLGRDAPARAAELTTWLERLESRYRACILPVDAAVAKRWAEMANANGRRDLEDLLIAATAAVHGLVVATRNARDFAGLGVPLFNPFEAGEAS